MKKIIKAKTKKLKDLIAKLSWDLFTKPMTSSGICPKCKSNTVSGSNFINACVEYHCGYVEVGPDKFDEYAEEHFNEEY